MHQEQWQRIQQQYTLTWGYSKEQHQTSLRATSTEDPILACVHEHTNSTIQNTQERNLRFAPVGRLFASAATLDTTLQSKSGIMDEDIPEPYMQILERLTKATVLVVGLGGVGSWAAEALCRSGVGNLILMDLDDICISNTNRQLHATSTSIGKLKTEEMKRRLQDVNPDCNITLIHDFVSPDNIHDILSNISHIRPLSACLDAIDARISKTALIAACARRKIPIVTCGSTAGRADPTKLVMEDLSRVSGDQLLRSCRRHLCKDYGFKGGRIPNEDNDDDDKAPSTTQRQCRKWRIKAVYSKELPITAPQEANISSLRRCDGAHGTACFLTGTVGFMAAGEIVSQIAKNKFLVPRVFRGDARRFQAQNE